jgi:hypothetical protein
MRVLLIWRVFMEVNVPGVEFGVVHFVTFGLVMKCFDVVVEEVDFRVLGLFLARKRLLYFAVTGRVIRRTILENEKSNCGIYSGD